MKMMKLKRLLIATYLLGLVASTQAAGTNLALNYDFELPAILSDGQTVPGEGEIKLTETDPAVEYWYPIAISGIQDWYYTFDERDDGTGNIVKTGTDIGLGYGLDLGDGNTSQVLNINRWGRRAVQTVAGIVIEEGMTYTLTARCYIPLDLDEFGNAVYDFKIGELALYADAMDPNDPSNFEAVPLLGIAYGVSAKANDEVPSDLNVLRNDLGYVDLMVSYTAVGGDPYLGQNLTMSMRTLNGSAGATYWDNVSFTVSAVPEPISLVVVGIGCLALVRRRRR